MKLLYEIYKNFKLVFRSWTTLFLIILAPLILIMLVGYSFSGDTLHDIRIGYTSESYVDLSEFSENISSFAELVEYDTAEDCIADLGLAVNHMCLEFSGEFEVKEGEIPTGQITFYYDNTRKRITLLLLTEVKDFFGLTAEKISLISAQEIFSNLQELTAFLNSRIDDVSKVKQESELIRQDLLKRKDELVKVKKDFTPKYLVVKEIQARVNNYAYSFNQSYDDLAASIIALRAAVSSIESELEAMNLTAQPLLSSFENLETAVADVEDTANATRAEIFAIKSSLDSVVAELDDINALLNDEIRRSDEYIARIDAAVERIDEITEDAKSKMQEISRLEPSFAEKLIRPIAQVFESVLEDVRDMQVAFPLLLATVIIFVSLLFSNIITLNEINSKAYVRNILAPVDEIVFAAGMLITNFAIIFLQVAVLLVVAQTQFGVDILAHLPDVVQISVILTVMFVCLGMTVAYISRSMQTSILLSTFVALAFFLFSDAINALEIMPELASMAAVYNPLVIVNGMLRQIFFFGKSLSDMHIQMLLLFVYLVLAFALLIHFSRKRNRQRI